MLNLELLLYNQNPHPVFLHVVHAPCMQASLVPQVPPPFYQPLLGWVVILNHIASFHGTDMPRGVLSVDKGTVVWDEPLEAVLPSGTGLAGTVTSVTCS